jgi:hypothetical protein
LHRKVNLVNALDFSSLWSCRTLQRVFSFACAPISEHPKLMKHRIPPKFHGLLCLIGFLAIIAITALIEAIGGAQ